MATKPKEHYLRDAHWSTLSRWISDFKHCRDHETKIFPVEKAKALMDLLTEFRDDLGEFIAQNDPPKS